MSAVVVAGKELLIAGGTLVGLFTSVDFLMSFQVGDLIKISQRINENGT